MKTNFKRRIQILHETHNITVIRVNGKQQALFCERCQRTVSTFSIEQTGASLQVGLEEICRLIGADRFHLVNTARSLALVCGNSLENENLRR
jgi:hypothetical protein